MAGTQRGIQSIEVGGTLLRVLVDADTPLPLRELAQRAGMPAAKAHPYVVSFGKLGLVEQDPVTGHYGLGPFALQLGVASLERLSPLRLAAPSLATLAATIGHTVAVAVLGSHGPTIVAIHESSRPIHVNMRVGTVMSIHNTATGCVFAAFLPASAVAGLVVRESRDPAITGQDARRVPDAAIDPILAEIRTRRMARAVGHPLPGINALSAPVFDHRGALALAITALGPSGIFDPAWDGPLAAALRDCVERVSARLGYRAGHETR
ncbi:MAG: IclR family transcriptional regulator [Casimicrobiaceae bacterium]